MGPQTQPKGQVSSGQPDLKLLQAWHDVDGVDFIENFGEGPPYTIHLSRQASGMPATRSLNLSLVFMFFIPCRSGHQPARRLCQLQEHAWEPKGHPNTISTMDLLVGFLILLVVGLSQ